MNNDSSFEKRVGDDKKIYVLPVERLHKECESNLVLKNKLKELFEACKVYAEKIEQKLYPRPFDDLLSQEDLQKIVDVLYAEDMSFENDIAEKIPELLRLLNTKNINELDILRNLKTGIDYARCAIETTQLLRKNTENLTQNNTRKAA
jgi:hypothetical protein